VDITAVSITVIAVVPATIAAVAAVRNQREIRTRNGLTTGQTIDKLNDGLDRVEEKMDRIDGRVDRVDRKLDQHLTDVGEGSGRMAAWVRKQMDKT